MKGRASHDDLNLIEYWARRRRKNDTEERALDWKRPRLLRMQDVRCLVCGSLLLVADHPPRSPEEWEQWGATVRKAIATSIIAMEGQGRSNGKERRLVHERCRLRNRRPTHEGNQRRPPGLLEP
jgi:RNA-directed DNA polymerase